MKLFCILLTAILCATASAQTIKTIGFNSTNGQVVANTGVLTFTNSVNFGGDLLLSNNTFFFGTNARWSPEDNSFSTALGFDGTNVIADTRANLGFSTNLNALWTATNASNARSAVELSLPALTNTSNVTMMRALAGTTNTNAPKTGVFYLTNILSITISNGIIVDVEEP